MNNELHYRSTLLVRKRPIAHINVLTIKPDSPKNKFGTIDTTM